MRHLLLRHQTNHDEDLKDTVRPGATQPGRGDSDAARGSRPSLGGFDRATPGHAYAAPAHPARAVGVIAPPKPRFHPAG